MKLKAGESINGDAEPIVTLIITAFDPDGLSYTETFTITVESNSIPIPVGNVGGSSNSSTPPPSSDGPTDQPSNDADSGDSDSNDRDGDDDSGSSDSNSSSNAIAGNLGIESTTADDATATADGTTVALLVIDIGQGTESESDSSTDAALINQVLDVSSSSGSSSSNSTDATLDRDASGLIRYGLSTNSLATTQANLAMMTKPGSMWNELDKHMQDVESQMQGDLIVVGAAGAATSSFMVGVVAWGLRTGFLASGLMAQLPAWRAVDPLLIMQGSGESDNESLEDLIKRRSEELDDQDTNQNLVD